MKLKQFLPYLYIFIAISIITDAILCIGPIYPEKESIFNNYMITFYSVLALTIVGLPFIFHKDFLHKYSLPASLIPLLTVIIYTYVYGFYGASNERRLGDYYAFSLVLFVCTLLWIGIRSRFSFVRILQIIFGGFILFYSFLSPLVFLGYFLIYGTEMDSFGLLAIFQTTPQEAWGYIRNICPFPWVILPLSLITIVFFACFYGMYRLFQPPHIPVFRFSSSTRWQKIIICILSVIFSLGLVTQLVRTFPIGLIYTIIRYPYMLEAFRGAYQNRDTIMSHISRLPNINVPNGTHIIVIGESACRDHMPVFSPSCTVNTTPWESAVSTSPNFVFSRQAYSNFPITAMSLSYALTAKNQYNDMILRESPTLIDVARAIGYYTTWISFQSRGTMWSAAVSAIGEHADRCYWENGYDGDVTKVLASLPHHDKEIIFIHLNGSHILYKDRVPEDFDTSPYLSHTDPYYDYHATILYTDHVLQDIFNYASTHLSLKSMIYFSDHGEDMKYNHTTAPFYFNMVRIPLWIYLSPDYQTAYPDLMPALRQNTSHIFTNDLIFDTASGIWQAKTNYYNSLYDWSSLNYGLDDTALTMHGKIMINDESDRL